MSPPRSVAEASARVRSGAESDRRLTRAGRPARSRLTSGHYRRAFLFLVAVGVAIAAAGCGDRAAFEDRTVGEVRAALEDEGLAICETAVTDEEGFTGTVGTERLEVARPACDDARDTGAVTLEAYDSKRARDAAIRHFEAMTRPTSGPAAAWTFGRFTISVSPDSSRRVFNRVTDAMELIGAE